jgi:glycosyltransferase involved in cell wall biosynthesis
MAERPSIALVSYAPDPGGVTTYQALQLEYLAERAEVSLIDECPETTLELLGPATRDRVAVVQVPLWSAPRRAASMIARQWRTTPPTVVALSNPALLVKLAGLLLAQRHRGAVLVQTLHSGTLFPTLRRRVAELLSGLMLTRVHDIVYVSAHTRGYWADRYPWLRGQGRVVSNGIPLTAAPTSPRVLGMPPRIAFAGRLEPEKGIDLYLDIARTAAARGYGWSFEVYGDGSWRAAVQAMAPAVRWHGHVVNSAGIFHATDLLLVTSPIENAPFVVLEAKREGIPTVAAPVGGLPEIVVEGEDGIFARSRGADDLIRALERAIEGYPALSAGCLARRPAFDVTRQVEKTWGRHLLPTLDRGA